MNINLKFVSHAYRSDKGRGGKNKIFPGARPELITDLAENGVGGRFWSKTFSKPLMLTPGARVARKNASKEGKRAGQAK